VSDEPAGDVDTLSAVPRGPVQSRAGLTARRIRQAGLLLLLAAMVAGFTRADPAFLHIDNLMSVLQSVSVVAILAAGVTLTLAVGGFDLSIGAVAASSVMAASYAMVVWGLDAVATALIGFAVLDRRYPNVFGTVVGAIFVGVLLNGLTMLNAPYYTQDFVKGAVLVGALSLTFGIGRGPG